MINITLLVFFVLPHPAIIITMKKLTHFEISCITMCHANAELIVDALIFNLGTTTRKLLVKFMKRFRISIRSPNHSTWSMPPKEESNKFVRNYSGNVVVSTL